MLTVHSNWYAPYIGRISSKDHIRPILGSHATTNLSAFAHQSLDPNVTPHLNSSSGVFQTFVDGTYISMPYPRIVPPGILHWRWENIKKQRTQLYKTLNYIAEKKLMHGNIRAEPKADNEILDEYMPTHKHTTGEYLNLNA